MSRANSATTHQYAGIAAWRVKLAAEIHSYADALAFLEARGSRSEKLAANMYVTAGGPAEDPYKQIWIILYRTTVLCYRRDGKFWADNGGWNTPTTSTRLNMVAPRGWFFSHERKRLVGNMGVPMRAGEWHSVMKGEQS